MAKIAIVGSGLAAAFARKAVEDRFQEFPELHRNSKVDVFSPTPKTYSSIGPIWFHWLPFEASPLEIMSVPLGDESVYLHKQWGLAVAKNNPISSFPPQTLFNKGYDVAQNVEKLWGRTLIQECPTFNSDEKLQRYFDEYDIIIQTFPPDYLKEKFARWKTHIPVQIEELSEEGFWDELKKYRNLSEYFTWDASQMNRILIYNGLWSDGWVRRTITKDLVYREYRYRVFTEYSSDIPFPQHMLDKNHLLVPDLCPDAPPGWEDDHKGKLILAGRWATMQRKYLSHQAYGAVQKGMFVRGL